jgi:hypothetical protein
MTNKKMRLWNAKLGENAAYSHKTSISWERLKRVQRGCSGGLFCIFTHVDTQTSTITREQISGMFLIKGGNPLIISAAEWTHKSHQCTTVYPWYQNHPDYLCELCSNSCKRQIPITQSHSRNILFTYDEKNTIDSAAEQLQEICNNLACVTGALYIVGVLHH